MAFMKKNAEEPMTFWMKSQFHFLDEESISGKMDMVK